MDAAKHETPKEFRARMHNTRIKSAKKEAEYRKQQEERVNVKLVK